MPSISGVTSDPKTELELLRMFFHTKQSRKQISKLFKAIFSNDQYGIVFDVMQKMYMTNQPIDLVAIGDIVRGSNVTEIDLVEFVVPEPAGDIRDELSLEFRIDNLKQMYFYRYSMRISNKMAGLAVAKDMVGIIKLSSTLDRVRKILFAREVADHFGVAVEVVNSPKEFIPSAFPKLAEMIGGYSRKALSSIGGKSGHNKTTFSLAEAIEQIKSGIVEKILFVSIDEPGEMIARRVIAKEMVLSLKGMRDKKIVLSLAEVKEAMLPFKNKLIIIDNARTPEAVQQAILDIRPDRTIVDHIQELSFSDNDGISESGITYSLKLFKEAAFTTNSNVTVLSQVKDKIIDERFEDKVPRPHDFYYASTIRQKSREQCVVYWKFKDSQDDIEKYFFDYIVWKSTYSDTGRVKFFIDPDHAKFAEKSVTSKVTDKPETEADVWRTIDKY